MDTLVLLKQADLALAQELSPGKIEALSPQSLQLLNEAILSLQNYRTAIQLAAGKQELSPADLGSAQEIFSHPDR